MLKPNIKLTYGRLWKFHLNIQDQLKKDTICAYFNSYHIEKFYAKFAQRITIMQNEMMGLQEKYFQKEPGTDKFKVEQTAQGTKFYPKDGFTQEGFNEEMFKLMSREVSILQPA